MLHRLLNSLILLPDPCLYQTPADVGLLAYAVHFPNAQGHTLRGWFFQAACHPVSPATPHSETPVVLFCPGTSGNLSSHLYYVEILCRAGCAVLGFDYTGFGASDGQAHLSSLLTDVLCAGRFLRQDKGIERYLVEYTGRGDVGTPELRSYLQKAQELAKPVPAP